MAGRGIIPWRGYKTRGALRSSEGQDQLVVLASAYLQSYPTNGTIYTVKTVYEATQYRTYSYLIEDTVPRPSSQSAEA